MAFNAVYIAPDQEVSNSQKMLQSCLVIDKKPEIQWHH